MESLQSSKKIAREGFKKKVIFKKRHGYLQATIYASTNKARVPIESLCRVLSDGGKVLNDERVIDPGVIC